MKKYISLIVILVMILLLWQCTSKKNISAFSSNTEINSDYKIEQVEVKNVHINDRFWLPIIQKVQKKTIAYAIEKCSEEGRFDNFLIAGKVKEGSVRGKCRLTTQMFTKL